MGSSFFFYFLATGAFFLSLLDFLSSDLDLDLDLDFELDDDDEAYLDDFFSLDLDFLSLDLDPKDR